MTELENKSRIGLVLYFEALILRIFSLKFSLLLAVLISVIFVFVLIGSAAANNTFGTDFSVYWRTANETSSAAYLPRAQLPFPYAPTMLLWISPLFLLGEFPAILIFIAVSVSAFILICHRHLSPTETALVMISPPVVTCLITGQVSVALAALMLWAVATDRRIAAGIAIAIIASIKPQIVLLAPLMLLLNRDWRAIASSALCFLFLVGMSIVIFGWQRWPEWIGSMSNFRSVLSAGNILNIAATPASVAEFYGFWPLPFLIGGMLIGIWLTLRCRNSPPLAKCAAIATASLLSAPYAMTYDLVVLAPFLVFAAFRGSIASAIALSALTHPIPLILTALDLKRSIEPAKPFGLPLKPLADRNVRLGPDEKPYERHVEHSSGRISV